MPAFLVETAPLSIFDVEAAAAATSGSGVARPTRLSQFLNQLSSKSPDGPDVDELLAEHGKSTTLATSEEAGGGLPSSASMASLNNNNGNPAGQGITPSNSVSAGLGSGATGNANGANQGKSANPEQDSFSYIESILESLAYLGKLSHAMDSVLQRAPIEIYNLVEATAIEVDERNDPIKRTSMRVARMGMSPKSMYSATFTSPGTSQRNTAAYSLLVRSSITSMSLKDDEAAIAGMMEMNTEILMDFFWTMFSKLDAVLQGFRVLHEVMSRIVARKGFKDTSLTNKSGGLVYSLHDVWRPIQIEVG